MRQHFSTFDVEYSNLTEIVKVLQQYCDGLPSQEDHQSSLKQRKLSVNSKNRAGTIKQPADKFR